MGLVKCYFVQEQIDKAIEACDFALAADDQYGEAYAYKAHCFFYLNNSDDAIENYQKAIELKAIPPNWVTCLWEYPTVIKKNGKKPMTITTK